MKPHKVRSVVGFGGILTTGDLYAVILFSKVTIPRATAQLFKPLALRVKEGVQPLTSAIFAHDAQAA